MGGKLPYIENHIAVRVNHCIVVIGGDVGEDVDGIQPHTHSVWLYNIFLEQWKKYHIPEKKEVPDSLIQACGVVIGEIIYTFGGERAYPTSEGYYPVTNELWKLTRNANGSFEWTRILVETKKKTPSPRTGHSGWEYDGKLWTFGGRGPLYYYFIDGYLNKHGDFRSRYQNQLLHFNPENNKWKNLKYLGTVPSPRAWHATTTLKDKVWLYGGKYGSIDFDDLYELDMCSLTWKLIQTATLKPEKRYACSLNVTRENQLVLHCGESVERDEGFEDTWILDLSSYSWKKCSDVYYGRSRHTGSLGINNSIIIIGGIYADYDIGEYRDLHAPTCNFMLEPNSLQQLSIKTVNKYRGQLPWECLPKKLIKLMQYGSKEDAQDSPPEANQLLTKQFSPT